MSDRERESLLHKSGESPEQVSKEPGEFGHRRALLHVSDMGAGTPALQGAWPGVSDSGFLLEKLSPDQGAKSLLLIHFCFYSQTSQLYSEGHPDFHCKTTFVAAFRI